MKTSELRLFLGEGLLWGDSEKRILAAEVIRLREALAGVKFLVIREGETEAEAIRRVRESVCPLLTEHDE